VTYAQVLLSRAAAANLLCRGPEFADKGYFRIKYGACGIVTVGEIYGLVWTPNQRRQIPVSLTPDPDQKGCYVYRAKPGDSIGMLADTWGVAPVDLLYNNSQAISDLEKPIAGQLLSVCGLGKRQGRHASALEAAC
jgi:hypothetical protein